MRLLDAAVSAAARGGLHVIIDPAFSAPLWATSGERGSGGARDPWFNTNIDVGRAAEREQMLARRYSGAYVPSGALVPLPRGETFTLWNEPNEHSMLRPHWSAGVPVSADWLRALIERAYPAIKRVQPSATVLIGNTTDSGADAQAGRGGVAPLQFIRRLACVDRQLQPVSDGACADFTTVPAGGYAHHPYERDAPHGFRRVRGSPAGPRWATCHGSGRCSTASSRCIASLPEPRTCG